MAEATAVVWTGGWFHPGDRGYFDAAENPAYYLVVRYPRRVDALPETPSEKIEKYELTQDAAARLDQSWDRESEGITVRRS